MTDWPAVKSARDLCVEGTLPVSEDFIRLLARKHQAVHAVRPTNWDDDEDPEQKAAWQLVEAALK